MPTPKNDALAWLKYARNDLGTAEREMNAHRNPRLRPYEIILHHCHQCAEKALKAFLLHKTGKYPFHHDLGSLLLECEKLDSSFKNQRMENHCLWLNSFWNVKYPDFTLSLDGAIASRGVNSAKRIYDFVSDVLGHGKIYFK